MEEDWKRETGITFITTDGAPSKYYVARKRIGFVCQKHLQTSVSVDISKCDYELTHWYGQQADANLNRANGEKRGTRARLDDEPVVRKEGEDETKDVLEKQHTRECFDSNLA